jgi:hypothetical protein
MRFMAAIVMREVLWDLASAFSGGTEVSILEGSFEKRRESPGIGGLSS